ncbi:MAG: ABC transporter ATP-binding protein [Bacteroidota bacterium]|nr:ABC transporter ATP-binding protein [Bacteroidota bacterium]
MLSAKNIHKRFEIAKGEFLHVLQGISLNVFEEEIIAIAGPSGAGKSTLLHILGMLDRPTEGELLFDGRNIFLQNNDSLAAIRNRHIGFIFQFHHLLPEFTAIENVMMPSLIAGNDISRATPRAVQLLADVGLSARMHHKPSELAGGEQQRVAVARALMNSPKLILADEPSGNLDTENARVLHQMIFELRKKYQQTFVIVTHNAEFAAMADRIVTLVDGKIKV